MTRKFVYPIVLAATATGFLAATAFAYGGHWHHRFSAAGLCLSVMSPTQRADLLPSLGSSWAELKTDRQNVHSAKAAITHDILYRTSVASDEANLTQAESRLQSDRDNLAAQVCKNVKNITAVQTLFGQLQGLHQQQQSLHQAAHGDFKSARSAQ
jgi:hypothetical protein